MGAASFYMSRLSKRKRSKSCCRWTCTEKTGKRKIYEKRENGKHQGIQGGAKKIIERMWNGQAKKTRGSKEVKGVSGERKKRQGCHKDQGEVKRKKTKRRWGRGTLKGSKGARKKRKVEGDEGRQTDQGETERKEDDEGL